MPKPILKPFNFLTPIERRLLCAAAAGWTELYAQGRYYSEAAGTTILIKKSDRVTKGPEPRGRMPADTYDPRTPLGYNTIPLYDTLEAIEDLLTCLTDAEHKRYRFAIFRRVLALNRKRKYSTSRITRICYSAPLLQRMEAFLVVKKKVLPSIHSL